MDFDLKQPFRTQNRSPIVPQTLFQAHLCKPSQQSSHIKIILPSVSIASPISSSVTLDLFIILLHREANFSNKIIKQALLNIPLVHGDHDAPLIFMDVYGMRSVLPIKNETVQFGDSRNFPRL